MIRFALHVQMLLLLLLAAAAAALYKDLVAGVAAAALRSASRQHPLNEFLFEHCFVVAAAAAAIW